MKNCVLLVILFINVIHCSDLNISDDSFPTCPFTLFRRKREAEYTRWRASLESTPEFIVKVFDDDLSTPRSKKVVPLNLQPAKIHLHSQRENNIIVGGVMVPHATADTTSTTDSTKDYTRFMLPTTPVTPKDNKHSTPKIVTQPDKIMKPRRRHPQRDESPPAGPQFLPRTQSSATWQYAPITPVGFTRRTTIAPITPSSVPYVIRLTRTRTTLSIKSASRTSADDEELRRYHQGDFELFDSPTLTVPSQETQETLSTEETISHSDYIQNNNKNVDADSLLNSDKKIGFDETDSIYQMMFYNDENEKKKTEGDITTDETANDEVTSTNVSSDEHTNEVDNNEEVTSEATTEANYDEITTVIRHSSRRSFAESNETDAPEVTKYAIDNPVPVVDSMLGKRPKIICTMVKLRQLNFNAPMSLAEIVHQMKQWAESSPIAKWVDITGGNFTAMENPIYMMLLDDPSSGQIVSAKQTIMIVAGIQGRDHHAVSSAMYVLYQLIERSDAHADLLTKYRFWVVPVFNPDGYDYSMTFPHRREWTKNMRQNWDTCTARESCISCMNFGLRCTVQPCYGVNLDRNFEYQWIPAEELRTEYPCGTLYPGSRQLSEVETQALTKFLHEINTPVFTFIAFKEGDVLGVMYPYSHTKKRRAMDYSYRQRASRAAAAAASISGRTYVAGQTSEFLPLYAGGIEDWVDSHMGIDNTYTIVMFRPSDTYDSKLITERVVHEAYAAMDTLVLQSGFETAHQPELAVLKYASSGAAIPKPSKLHFISIYFTLLYLILDNLSCKLS